MSRQRGFLTAAGRVFFFYGLQQASPPPKDEGNWPQPKLV
jgi:hypothetical protein